MIKFHLSILVLPGFDISPINDKLDCHGRITLNDYLRKTVLPSKLEHWLDSPKLSSKNIRGAQVPAKTKQPPSIHISGRTTTACNARNPCQGAIGIAFCPPMRRRHPPNMDLHKPSR